jgi:hypothetical protein
LLIHWSGISRVFKSRSRGEEPLICVDGIGPLQAEPFATSDAPELLALQGVYAAWLEALPDTLQGTATADALQAIVELDLDRLAAIEPPRGYGRD